MQLVLCRLGYPGTRVVNEGPLVEIPRYLGTEFAQEAKEGPNIQILTATPPKKLNNIFYILLLPNLIPVHVVV